MNSLWMTFALLTALAAATQDAWIKRYFSHRSIYVMSILFGVLYGGIVFREPHMRYRLSGAVMMVAGAVSIMVLGR